MLSIHIFSSFCYLTALCFAAEATDAYYCPYGWNVYRDGESCVRLMKYPTTAVGAEENCRTYGGHLVSIRNEHEFDFIAAQIMLLNTLDHLTIKNGVWIGTNNWWTDGSSFPDKEPSKQQKFLVSTSDPYRSGCILQKIIETDNKQWTERKTAWAPANCRDEKYPYICQKPPFRRMGGFYAHSSTTTISASGLSSSTSSKRPTVQETSPSSSSATQYLTTTAPRKAPSTTTEKFWREWTRTTTRPTTTTTKRPYDKASRWPGAQDSNGSYAGLKEHQKKMSGNMKFFMGLIMCTGGVAAVVILGFIRCISFGNIETLLAKLTEPEPEASPEIKIL